MGLQDRDWYREAQLEREKQEEMNATKARFGRYTANFITKKTAKSEPYRTKSWTGTLIILIFSVSLLGNLYALMNYHLKPICDKKLTDYRTKPSVMCRIQRGFDNGWQSMQNHINTKK